MMSEEYLELLKHVVTRAVFPESADKSCSLSQIRPLKLRVRNLLIKVVAKLGLSLVKRGRYRMGCR